MSELNNEIISENEKVAEYFYKPGMAHIKPQFIKVLIQSNELKNDKVEESEPVAKKAKIKGMNRNRSNSHIPNQRNDALKICPYIKSSQACPYEGKCRYEHNTDIAVIDKKINMDGECFNYKVRGFCPMGIMCLWSSSHVKEGINMTDDNKLSLYKPVINTLNKDVLTLLRKKKYNFNLSYNSLDMLKISYGGRKDVGDVKVVKNEEFVKVESEIVADVGDNNNRNSSISFISNETKKKNVNWNSQLYLAPLTTVGNLPFRRVCKDWGADVTCSEMAVASKLIQGVQSEWALLKRHPSEDIFGVQICGAHPEVMTKCAQMIDECCKVDFIDVNCGCPIDLVCDKGEGCGLLRNKKRLENIVVGMKSVANCPITVKTRIGYSLNDRTAHILLPKLRDSGAAMVVLHGRTKEQRYTKNADWDYIAECVNVSSPMPVYGNGDILSFDDYIEHKEKYGVTGIMIGRGALIKPWLFTEIKEQRTWDISSGERFDMLKKYANYGLEYWGSDYRGVENTRKFLLEWMSFLHRYIPVGLLERLPQRINERPPIYFGRDDLETIMISDNCVDWIKLSEMILGPVPDNFQFIPKHRAHSY